ncbi:hypothetical protein FA13DRAFT_1705011 [Coprinellus micaceus]|uniref:Uncharacterized protein n=1 Tax=Coprinellus micaceus TaxID=71717 RepID=A0A4Y7TUQ8_COPMI|nr:hypothetical protein FA13DRAFT_1705011 [Coprinellus micaceus]
MDRFDSSFSPSVASASSSTLIVTPHPHSKDDSLLSNEPVLPRRPTGIPMTRMVPTRMSGKGFIEPHHSHLPRRAKHRSVSRHRPPSSIDTNKTEGGFESGGGSRDVAERRPVPAPAAPSSPTAKVRHPTTGPLQPHISNLPRRRGHARRPHSIANQREERLCLQEIGAGSRIFVGVSRSIWRGEPSRTSSDEEADEEEEADLKAALRRHCSTRPVRHRQRRRGGAEAGEGSSPPFAPEIRVRRSRMHAAHEEATRARLLVPPPVVFRVPPRSHPIPLLLLGGCILPRAIAPARRRPPSPAIPPLTPLSEDSSHSSLPPEDDYSGTLHQLIIKLHDEELLVIDDEDGRRPGRGDLKPGALGLRNEWRGLLRYEGIAQLEGAWKPKAPST